MSSARLLELWMPPPGYRLASVLATTYQLQADFIEEDLLPVALGLRLPAARERSFRLELEQALQGVDITIYLHPDGYQPGERRSPRIDLVTLPEPRLPKLHAKVSLLRFVPEGGAPAEQQVVRMLVGSANLTAPGYRDNIEVAIALDDAPGASAATVTAVRDAAAWMRDTVGDHNTDQARSQHRSMQTIFAARPVAPQRDELRFVGLRTPGGLVAALRAAGVADIRTLTAVSPFWPSGNDLKDVVESLFRLCGGVPAQVRLVGPAGRDADGIVHPVMPIQLLHALLATGTRVAVAAADPGYGCVADEPDEGDESADLGKPRSGAMATRDLHAKLLVLESASRIFLVMGSFNLTRKGLGLHGHGNTEAGMVWSLPKRQSPQLSSLLAFAHDWREVENAEQAGVLEPTPQDGESALGWPPFLHAVRATRDAVIVEGDANSWPDKVTMHMRDIRARLVQREENFDSWAVTKPEPSEAIDGVLPLRASWLVPGAFPQVEAYRALPDLELVMEWEGKRVVLPVVFDDKHEFPVVERAHREDERALIDWFLGLRPEGSADGDGFGHAIDPEIIPAPREPSDTTDILSYLVRDFVHALPGIRGHLAEGVTTETALRTVLLGARSPAALAEEVLQAWQTPRPSMPRKTAVATAFQLVELYQLVWQASLPEWPDAGAEPWRAQCLARIRAALDPVLAHLPSSDRTPALKAYLATISGGVHAPR
jgi:hypothetical protein